MMTNGDDNEGSCVLIDGEDNGTGKIDDFEESRYFYELINLISCFG